MDKDDKEILGYVKCTAPGCSRPMAVRSCAGKRAGFLIGRCENCGTEQRSTKQVQDYLSGYKPLEELDKVPEKTIPEPSSPEKAVKGELIRTGEPESGHSDMGKCVIAGGLLGSILGGLFRLAF
ncbi:hypothetical protein VA7868_02938 [Vibrio aerogenes CECT 7868]|uniref:Uncharacterized protein n=1 Tax=Vibrio aerogenes CECT 7868 TaxID=1216006 RepID=A0A1M5ZMH5_9VIBR|nr:hypothetical protein [Vibrio aerogenes]SHI25374.1 hypothetical protein VA7868_02938 [Vibrio aerogenes CECT 7868]